MGELIGGVLGCGFGGGLWRQGAGFAGDGGRGAADEFGVAMESACIGIGVVAAELRRGALQHVEESAE